MEEMVEPDRTIMIVSIIGLVVIWGSFFYHKFVQDGGGDQAEQVAKEEAPAQDDAQGNDVAKKQKKNKKR